MEKIIDWKIIRDAIDNSWFSNDPHVQEEEIDLMAIDISGKVDEVIRQEINKVLDEFDDLSCSDAPNVCSCCQEMDNKVKEIRKRTGA